MNFKFRPGLRTAARSATTSSTPRPLRTTGKSTISRSTSAARRCRASLIRSASPSRRRRSSRRGARCATRSTPPAAPSTTRSVRTRSPAASAPTCQRPPQLCAARRVERGRPPRPRQLHPRRVREYDGRLGRRHVAVVRTDLQHRRDGGGDQPLVLGAGQLERCRHAADLLVRQGHHPGRRYDPLRVPRPLHGVGDPRVAAHPRHRRSPALRAASTPTACSCCSTPTSSPSTRTPPACRRASSRRRRRTGSAAATTLSITAQVRAAALGRPPRVLLLNRATAPAKLEATWAELGLPAAATVNVYDVVARRAAGSATGVLGDRRAARRELRRARAAARGGGGRAAARGAALS